MYKYLNKILLLIVFLAFSVRVVGITYGLPLWLVGDEPPFVLSALKMIELKTLIPALHEKEFLSVTYFPPYQSYFYLVPFLGILSYKFFLFSGNTAMFINYLSQDLSIFFVVARLISVIMGTATILLLYGVANNIFKNKVIAFLSSAFLSFSALHVTLSHWGRDWVPAVMFFVIAIYFLTHPEWSQKNRYVFTAVTAGIGFGISIIAGFITLFMALWIFWNEKKTLLDIVFNKHIWVAASVFLLLAIVSVIIFPGGFFFTGANSIAVPKTFERLLNTYFDLLRPLLFVDQILLLWALIGLCWMFFWERRLFWIFVVFINCYIFAYFLTFHTGDRFALYFYPLVALAAGYGLHTTWLRIPRWRTITIVLGALSLITMFAIDIQIDRIIIRNDTRMQARQWIEKNIPEKSKIIVLAPLTRLASIRDAIAEQETIEPSSLRKVDQSERVLPSNMIRYPVFHALNLYTVSNSAAPFYNNIDEYIKKNNYKYALLTEDLFGKDKQKNNAQLIIRSIGTPITSFKGSGPLNYDLTEGTVDNILHLISGGANGPTVTIYQFP